TRAGAGPRGPTPALGGAAPGARRPPRVVPTSTLAALRNAPDRHVSALHWAVARERVHTRVLRGVAQQFFDAHQLVVLGHPFTARGGTRLDLAAPGGHG